jgi:hypothetical protein
LHHLHDVHTLLVRNGCESWRTHAVTSDLQSTESSNVNHASQVFLLDTESGMNRGTSKPIAAARGVKSTVGARHS